VASEAIVKAYFNYAGLNWPGTEVAGACREAETRFGRLLFSTAGGEEYAAQMVRTRASIARLLGLGENDLDHIFFVPNASSGLSVAMRAMLAALRGDAVVITSDQEHPAVERILESADGASVRIERIGAASEAEFAAQLEARCAARRPAFVVLSQVSYKDGRILPIAKVAEHLAAVRIPLLVDANQAIGQIPVDLSTLECAAYIFSGHKWLEAPMGTGAMVVKRELLGPAGDRILRMLNDLQSGTLSYVALAGLEAGCTLAKRSLGERVRGLGEVRARILGALRGLPGISSPVWQGAAAPGIASLLVPDARPSQLIAERMLARHGVAVRPFAPPERPNAIRISWTAATTEAEIDLLREALARELR
jgi:selenocysteine lyase/cysteine desulfurase